MGKVIPHIHKNKLPQKLYYPMRYQEVESCFENLNDSDIYLYFWFSYQEDLLKRQNRIEAKGEYWPITIKFDPERDASFLHGYAADIDLQGTILLEVHVNALPRTVAQEAELHQRHLSDFVRMALSKLGRDVWKNKWHYSLGLFMQSQTFASVLQQWNGLQELPPFTTIFPLKDETNELSSEN